MITFSFASVIYITMFRTPFGLIRHISSTTDGFQLVLRSQNFVNHVSKRCAGHSQWANRKEAKESSQKRKSSLLLRFQREIKKEISQSKNPNVATNSKLQSILSEARKSSIPQSSLESALKAGAATLKSDVAYTFCFCHDIGICAVIEVNSSHLNISKLHITGLLKKFGFQLDNNGEERYQTIGIVICKPLKSDSTFDKAFEDAIACNFSDVEETEVGEYEFQCDPKCLKECTQKLTDLGYSVELSEVQYRFLEQIKIDDKQILDRLEKISDKLNYIAGFIRIQYNIEGM